ncbi:PIN domain-containing protein [Candidatus Micrarchaeota archaeon]|nr:PIN domain-containing protein [Candidatus Micrarchaeota archaeon]
MLLDSSAWIEYFLATAKGKKILQWLTGGPAYASAISYAEITRWALRSGQSPEPFIHQMEKVARVLPMEKNTLVAAGYMTADRKKTHEKWGLADGIMYATARKHGLELLTVDHDFKGLENAIIIE